MDDVWSVELVGNRGVGKKVRVEELGYGLLASTGGEEEVRSGE